MKSGYRELPDCHSNGKQDLVDPCARGCSMNMHFAEEFLCVRPSLLKWSISGMDFRVRIAKSCLSLRYDELCPPNIGPLKRINANTFKKP